MIATLAAERAIDSMNWSKFRADRAIDAPYLRASDARLPAIRDWGSPGKNGGSQNGYYYQGLHRAKGWGPGKFGDFAVF